MGHTRLSGINYYGIEVVKGLGVPDKDYEYSDSGQTTSIDGIKFSKLQQALQEYPFIITENGIADGNDWFRPLYITEHLAAISGHERRLGVKVFGYIHWTLTDNFEWGDG